MNAAAKNRHHRTMDAVVLDVEIMDTASALDWRVLHAVEIHQGYKTWRCNLSLDRIAKVARCSNKSAGNSSRRWAKWGVLKITRTGGANIFEVVQDFQPSPDRVHRQRHITRKSQNRGSGGKWAPSMSHQSPPSDGLQSPPSDGHITRGLSSEVLNKNPPPPPTGGNDRSSEASARPVPAITYEAWKELVKTRGRTWTIDYAREHNYPIPEFLLGEEKTVSPEGKATAEALERDDLGKGGIQ